MISRLIIIFIVILAHGLSMAQDCNITLSGRVIDEHDGQPLAYATVWIAELDIGTSTDIDGAYSISDICPQHYHVSISHIGCESVSQVIDISSDTSIIIYLEHHSELLTEVTIEDSQGKSSSIAPKSTIASSDISRAAGDGLAELTKSITGVSTLSNGSGISKPIIHGMYGNRVMVLNNGLAQAGQQWGNDHAPEIDPLIMDRITVVKDASAVRYGTRALGGVIQVSPMSVSVDPHVHGHLYYGYRANGRGHALHVRLERGSEKVQWRMQGGWQKSGDLHAPDYYLRNTGSRLTSLSGQIKYQPIEKLSSELYYSYYGNELGVFRGSHIGNLTDLRDAIGRTIPFFTKDDFSYSIAAPRQRIDHHLIKSETKYFLSKSQYISLVYGLQINDRKEYDVRRGGRSDIPALSLGVTAHSIDLSMSADQDYSRHQYGIQHDYRKNLNEPGTGILPLIPNYLSGTTGAYYTYRYNRDRVTAEVGARGEYRYLRAAVISSRPPRQVENITRNDVSIASTAGVYFTWNDVLHSALRATVSTRPPEINELFSAGLHQGIAAIEQGNSSLDSEWSYKLTYTQQWQPSHNWRIVFSPYLHYIHDFIYLIPEAEPRLTIRGAFPVYNYVQTDAVLYGSDMHLAYDISPRWRSTVQVSYIIGTDHNNNRPLIYVPPADIRTTLLYAHPSVGRWHKMEAGIELSHTFTQKRYAEDIDLLPPPTGYTLLGAHIRGSIKMGDQQLTLSLSVQNLTNRRYRDYLNRLRYFADDEGRDVRATVRYSF